MLDSRGDNSYKPPQSASRINLKAAGISSSCAMSQLKSQKEEEYVREYVTKFLNKQKIGD